MKSKRCNKTLFPFFFISWLLFMIGCGGGEKTIEGEWIFPDGWSEIKKVGENYVLQMDDEQYILTQENGIYKATFSRGEAQFVYNPETDELLMNFKGNSYPVVRYDLDQFVGYWASIVSYSGKQICVEVSRKKDNFEIEYYLHGEETGWKQEKVNAMVGPRKFDIVGTNKFRLGFPFQGQSEVGVPNATGMSFTSYKVSRLKSRKDFPEAVRNYKPQSEAKASEEIPQTQADNNSTKRKPTYYLVATVDQLNIRATPRLDAKKISQIAEGVSLTYLGEKTDFTTRITLRGKVRDEPWYKVMLADGSEGWVYGGAVEMRKM